MSELYNEVYNDFYHYSGSVIMNRAICDVRDMLKPSARMLMYSQEYITKNRPNKPFVKSARVVGDALGHYYYHGDASCYGTYMRMAKPFAMRYPLEDCQGNSGTITATGDEAASRYTELRLSKLAGNLFTDIEKKTISEWDNSFDDTDIYPRVLPSKGFYNIVNGSTGIGI
jgi:DNA gyrase subunit A